MIRITLLLLSFVATSLAQIDGMLPPEYQEKYKKIAEEKFKPLKKYLELKKEDMTVELADEIGEHLLDINENVVNEGMRDAGKVAVIIANKVNNKETGEELSSEIEKFAKCVDGKGERIIKNVKRILAAMAKKNAAGKK